MGLVAESGWETLSSLSNQSKEICPPSAALMSSLQRRAGHATQISLSAQLSLMSGYIKCAWCSVSFIDIEKKEIGFGG